MLEFIVIITIAAIACFICEQLCKNAKPDSSDAFVQDWQALKNDPYLNFEVYEEPA